MTGACVYARVRLRASVHARVRACACVRAHLRASVPAEVSAHVRLVPHMGVGSPPAQAREAGHEKAVVRAHQGIHRAGVVGRVAAALPDAARVGHAVRRQGAAWCAKTTASHTIACMGFATYLASPHAGCWGHLGRTPTALLPPPILLPRRPRAAMSKPITTACCLARGPTACGRCVGLPRSPHRSSAICLPTPTENSPPVCTIPGVGARGTLCESSLKD